MARTTEQSATWASARPDGTALDFLGVASPLYARVADALAPSGLTYSEYRLLDGLRRAGRDPEDGRVRGSVPGLRSRSETMDALEARGLVRRPAAGGVQLTEFGRARANMAARRLDALVADFASRLDMSEAVGLSMLLARLARQGAGGRDPVQAARQMSG